MTRIRSVSTVALLAVAALPLGLAGPAAAAPGGDVADLQSALAGCTGPYAVTLTQDLSDPTAVLTIGCDATLDLAGHDLAVASVDIAGGTFELTDSTSDGGTLTANASGTSLTSNPYNGMAGVRTGGPLVTSGYAHLVATAGWQAAGVGGVNESGIRDGGSVTARDHSSILASGSSYASGIGGGNSGDGGSVHAEDFATVKGYARDHGGGIGSGYNTGSRSGSVVADDDSVVAGYSVEGGAGIGGAYGSYVYGGPTVVVNDRATVIGDSDVDRDGYGGGAGIGTGDYNTNNYYGSGSVTVNDEGTVIARGSQGGSAVGPGARSAAPTSTFLTVNGGTVRLLSDLVVPDIGTDPGVVVAAGGRIVQGDGTTAGITGSGTVRNDGAITVPTAAVTVAEVTQRHTTVTFDAAGGSTTAPVTVFADSFTTGGRTLPTPTLEGYAFTGWVTGSRIRQPLTADTDLTTFGSSADGTAVQVAARATWRQVVAVPEPDVTNTTSATRGTAAPAVGDTLRASVGATSPTDATVSFAWQRDLGGTTTLISGATGPTYVVTSDDLGATLRVLVSAERASYATGATRSQPTGVVQRAPVEVSAPTLTNATSPKRGTATPVVGNLLRASADAGVSLAWQRTVGGATTPIAGATAATYRLTPEDLGTTISVVATAADATGTATSQPTGSVQRAQLRGVPRVTVTGTPRVGQRLTATYDAWTPTPTVQWYRDGTTPIGGATRLTYTLKRADEGHRITAVVTFTRPGYVDRTRRASRAVR